MQQPDNQRRDADEPRQREGIHGHRTDFQQENPPARNRTAEHHPQGPLLDFIADNIASHERQIERAHQEDRPEQHEKCECKTGEIRVCGISGILDHADKRPFYFRQIQEKKDEKLDGKKSAEPDISPLAGEELDQLAPKLLQERVHQPVLSK